MQYSPIILCLRKTHVCRHLFVAAAMRALYSLHSLPARQTAVHWLLGIWVGLIKVTLAVVWMLNYLKVVPLSEILASGRLLWGGKQDPYLRKKMEVSRATDWQDDSGREIASPLLLGSSLEGEVFSVEGKRLGDRIMEQVIDCFYYLHMGWVLIQLICLMGVGISGELYPQGDNNYKKERTLIFIKLSFWKTCFGYEP